MSQGSFYIEPRKELIWYEIDLDGTLAKPVWPDPGIGNPIEANILKAWELVNHGYKLIIITSRHWADYELIQKWLELNDIPYTQIICGKPLVHRVVDDRAINAAAESWL